ncbi:MULTISPECIES: BT_3987 domain-containing protein [unclassified Carboxylicivirga]|uniref:BT_3987 domain-containing protein n=1 Tax=Carboxylicivirga TaxID=1628153 RepID=UPI003D32E37D
MKRLINNIGVLLILALFFGACEKSAGDEEWGIAKIYMPQANYEPYITTLQQPGATCKIDEENNKLLIFLGVYRSGLQDLNAYSVDVYTSVSTQDGVTPLPNGMYDVPSEVTCPSGERDASFYLKVDLAFLQSNIGTDYAIAVGIENPSKYELNSDLSVAEIKITTSALFHPGE